MNAIEIKGLYKEFHDHKSLLESVFKPFKKPKAKVALDSIDLYIKKNELFCLIGPNGAGKTTLIKILCTLILPTCGSAVVNGHDVLKEEEAIRGSIGFISGEERSFFWRLTCFENLRFFAALYNIPTSRMNKEIERVIDIACIEEPEKRFQECSVGAKHRLGIARALLKEPDILFMDEPTKSLDPLMADSFREFIKKDLVQRHKKTVFFATHNLSEAELLADRLGIIDKGRIKAVATLGELRDKLGIPGATLGYIFNYYINRTS